MRKLKDLSFNELVNCLDTNPALWNKAHEEFTKDTEIYIDELISSWENATDYYELGSDVYIPEISVSSKNYHDFLEGLKQTNSNFGFLDEKMPLINRLLEKITTYKLYVLGYLTSKKLELLETWFDDSIEEICNAAAAEIQSYFTTNTDCIADWLQEELNAESYQMGVLNDIVVSEDLTAYLPAENFIF